MLREPKLVRYSFGNYWWNEVNPHEYQICRADSAQTIIGRLVEIPPHGRDKGKWVLPDHNVDAADSKEAILLLELAAHDVPPAPPQPAAPVATAPAPAWLSMREAAARRGVAVSTFNAWLIAGKIPGAEKVPDPAKPGVRIWRVPSGAVSTPPPIPPAAPPPVPVADALPEPPPAPKPKLTRVVLTESPAAPATATIPELYREIGRLLGRIETLEKDVRFLALRQQAVAPQAAPSLWQRLAGVSSNGPA